MFPSIPRMVFPGPTSVSWVFRVDLPPIGPSCIPGDKKNRGLLVYVPSPGTVTPMRAARYSKTPMRHRGLTLLELIVVLVVLAVLAAIAIPTFAGVFSKSKYAALRATATSLDTEAMALGAFHGQPADNYVLAAQVDLPSADQVTITNAGAATPQGEKWTISRNNMAVCLITSGVVDEPGTVTDGACSGSGGTSTASGSGGATVYTPPPTPTTESYNGSPDTYTVPAGVNYVYVTATGAQGQAGGNGGEVAFTIPVTAGQVLWAYLGQQPTSAATGGGVSGAPGGFGQGGSGYANGTDDAAGGGATSVFLTTSLSQLPTAPTATATGSLIAVAGAGGGAGGAGGNPGLSTSGAGGGTQTAGGAGSLEGSFGLGGSSQPPSTADFPGGGGGGGFYGGGAATGSNSNFGSGGGGGSSWAASTAEQVTYTTGAESGNGSASFQPLGALAPTGLTATYDATSGAVDLSWTASPSSGITGYAIDRNGAQIGTVGTGTTSYVDAAPPADQIENYSVAATTSSLGSSAATATAYTGTCTAEPSPMPSGSCQFPAGTTVTASSTYPASEFSPGNVVDGSLATAWNSNSATSTITVTPPTSVLTSQLVLAVYGSGSTYTYSVTGVQGGSTVTLGSATSSSSSSPAMVTIPLSGGPGPYSSFTISISNSAGNYAEVYEVAYTLPN